MIRIALLLLCLIGVGASQAEAKSWRLSCSGFHFVRTHFTPAQISMASLGIRNVNTGAAVTLERLVVRDIFGNVLSDSGPAGLEPHPLNTDYPEGAATRDITTVPAGETRYIRTAHFPWGYNPVPGPSGAGNVLQFEVELSMGGGGKPELVLVGVSRNVRERHVNAQTGAFFEAAEYARDNSGCLRIE